MATESFWFGKKEGVRVTYDREQVSFAALLKVAGEKRCDLFVWTTTDAQLQAAKQVVGDRAQPYAKMKARSAPRLDNEQQYYLRKSPLVRIPMTRAQATRLNAAIGRRDASWRRLLSPRQLAFYELAINEPDKESLSKLPIALGVPMQAAVKALTEALQK